MCIELSIRVTTRGIGPVAGRALLSFAVVAALALLWRAEPASPEGQIVIHGANPGTHLEISVKQRHLVVDGWMSRHRPAGCRYKRPRLRAVCSLSGVSSVSVVTGPHGDMVEVLDKLPVPMTVYLGDGSDKFIGNGENDTCYPEGARRNRCIGGPGRDICITGQQNSDCVGGGGNDYCQTGAGSDGCWGGGGDDVCRMGPGHDGCHGEGGRDKLFGGPSSDRLYGGRGLDHCDGLPGRGRSQGCERGPRR